MTYYIPGGAERPEALMIHIEASAGLGNVLQKDQRGRHVVYISDKSQKKEDGHTTGQFPCVGAPNAAVSRQPTSSWREKPRSCSIAIHAKL